MNRPEVLPPEDRAEFERVLDEALRTARLTAGGEDRFPEEALRSLALDALPEIAAAAGEEYRRFDQLRHALHHAPSPSPSPSPSYAGSGSGDGSGGRASGVMVVVVALVPVLAAIAAVIFLLLGYALGLAEPEPAMAEPMREVGWIFAVLAGLGVLVAVAGLVVAAVNNGSRTAIRARPGAGTGPRAEEVARAREEWRRALLEHGILPFLREHAAVDAADGDGDGEDRRTPRLRFSSPRFTSPDFDSTTPSRGGGSIRPHYSHPDFSGPRFGSPHFTSPEEGRDEADRESARAERGYAHAEFSSPDFASPAFDSGTGEDDDVPDGPRPGRRYGQPDFSSPEFTSPSDGDRD